MRTRQLMRLVKEQVLPHLPGFRTHRSFVYSSPVGMVLRGFAFTPSYMDPAAFTVEVFAQPLYVPNDCVCYTFGARLSELKYHKDIWWRLREFDSSKAEQDVVQMLRHIREDFDFADVEQVFANILQLIHEVGLPFIERLSTPEDFVVRGAKISGVPHDPYVREAIAYSRVLTGDYKKAAQDMRKLYPELIRDMPNYPWMGQMAERVNRMMSLLEQSSEAAVQQLYEWHQFTLTQLRLEKEI
ncbi:MAG: hypothetical protein KatS3mg016_1304 [Fimbriimonadales bacterium]|nr:MAG: hypothetical protein KatS3mg016_1304 [Fimbriimonadales bacterium]